MTTPLPQPERHWYHPPTPPGRTPIYVQPATLPAPPPAQPAEPHYAWWVYALVITGLVVLLPLWGSLLLAWWIIKAILLAFGVAAIPWIPWPVPDRYRNHGRWS